MSMLGNKVIHSKNLLKRRRSTEYVGKQWEVWGWTVSSSVDSRFHGAFPYCLCSTILQKQKVLLVIAKGKRLEKSPQLLMMFICRCVL